MTAVRVSKAIKQRRGRIIAQLKRDATHNALVPLITAIEAAKRAERETRPLYERVFESEAWRHDPALKHCLAVTVKVIALELEYWGSLLRRRRQDPKEVARLARAREILALLDDGSTP